jgi:hypothetical protein
MARTMHLMNSLGHLTVHWEEQNDESIHPVIQSMLDHGYRFFILKDAAEVQVSAISEITDRRVIIPDNDLQQLCAAGLLAVGGELDEDAETTGDVAQTVEDVTAHDTVVTPPMRGG